MTKRTISSEDLEKKWVGKTLGNMKVLKYVYTNDDGRHMFNTICLRCGKESIRRVDRKSPVYCMKCQKDSFKKYDHNETSFNKQYCSLRTNANYRNIPFELTKEDLRILSKQNCFYCGQQPDDSSYAKYGNKRIQNSKYTCNGIDRLNSLKGYTKDNMVTCCATCNLMKNRFSLELFLSRIKLIYDKHISR